MISPSPQGGRGVVVAVGWHGHRGARLWVAWVAWVACPWLCMGMVSWLGMRRHSWPLKAVAMAPGGVLPKADKDQPLTTCILAGPDHSTLYIAHGTKIYRRNLTVEKPKPR